MFLKTEYDSSKRPTKFLLLFGTNVSHIDKYCTNTYPLSSDRISRSEILQGPPSWSVQRTQKLPVLLQPTPWRNKLPIVAIINVLYIFFPNFIMSLNICSFTFGMFGTSCIALPNKDLCTGFCHLSNRAFGTDNGLWMNSERVFNLL